MKHQLSFGMAVWVICGALLAAQSSTPSTEPKEEPPASKPNAETQPPSTVRKATAAIGPLVVLTDTKGVDFGPYFQRVLHDVRMNWYHLMPASARAPLMKKGKLTIDFAINKDGKVVGMRLVSTSGDKALDSAAWDGITASNPFPSLPSEFGGPYIGLRLTFFYNPDRADLQ
jgi:TonB family protein